MKSSLDAESPLALAEAAHARAEHAPLEAAGLAARALALARRSRDREAESAALHALGFAYYELGDPRTIRTLRAAVRTAERHGLPRRAALARRPLAGCLAAAGRFRAALHELDLAFAALDGVEAARSEVARLAVLGMSGQAPVSLAFTEPALQTLRLAGDTVWEARLLGNRGQLRALRGEAAAARLDIELACELDKALGRPLAAAHGVIELARIDLLEADVVGSLARLDAVERLSPPPLVRCFVELVRAEALVEARLFDEARAALREATSLAVLAGREADVAGMRLDAARLSLLAGDPARALDLAVSARRRFAASGQRLQAARASGTALAAAFASGRAPTSGVITARRAAAVLAAAGWRRESLRLHLLAARVAVAAGRRPTARAELVACAPLRRRGGVADRIDVHHVEALLRLAGGDRAGADRALRAGLRLLDDYRAALGAAELRATASDHGVELARAGLRLAIEDGSPRRILAWAERHRASALRLPRVRPPDDPELRESEGALRRLGAELRRAEDEGRPTRALAGRQVALETTIRRLSRHARGEAGPALRIPAPRELAARLGDRSLTVFVELDGTLRAVTLRRARLAAHDLGPAAAVYEQLDWLRFGLSRVAAGRASALEGVEDAAARLDAVLGPVLGEVIVPTGALHAMPWSALPSLRGRPVTIAPSAAVWLGLEERPAPRSRRIVLAAGPRLRHSADEVRAVARELPGALALVGEDATAEAVLGALDGARLAHVASHGRFRSDNPLFSSFELADGNVTALDLQRLRRAPDTLVLSACDLALSDRRPGDELLGVSAALLGIGTRTIVASVVPVPDDVAGRLMVAFHRSLAAGAGPAAALAAAQAAEPAPAGFVCLGAG